MFYSSILRTAYTLWIPSFGKVSQLCFFYEAILPTLTHSISISFSHFFASYGSVSCPPHTHEHTRTPHNVNFKWPIIDENYINFDEYKANSSFVSYIAIESLTLFATTARDATNKIYITFKRWCGHSFSFATDNHFSPASRSNYETTSNINEIDADPATTYNAIFWGREWAGKVII